MGATASPPFQGRGQGWVSCDGGSMPPEQLCAALGSFSSLIARTHPYPSLEREGR